MTKTIKKVIAELTDMEVSRITNDMHLVDDLYLDDDDISDILDELEDRLGFEFENRNYSIEYVNELIAFVMESV